MIKLIGTSLIVGTAMMFNTLVGGVVYIVTGGVAMVEVETPEVALTLPIPTHLADAGLLAAHFAMPHEELAEVRAEIEPYLPIVEEMLRELSRVDNGTVLVSVETGTEQVLIEKQGGRFHVRVDAPDAHVEVSIPARSVRRLAGSLNVLL